jgi:TonB family protein
VRLWRPVTAIVSVLILSACADTVTPLLGGLKIGTTNAPLKYPVRVDAHHFDYPEDAWDDRVGGTVVLKLRISPAGVVDSAYVLESSGHSSLDSAAVADSRRLRYDPAEQAGEPIEVWAKLPVIYPLPKETEEYDP